MRILKWLPAQLPARWRIGALGMVALLGAGASSAGQGDAVDPPRETAPLQGDRGPPPARTLPPFSHRDHLRQNCASCHSSRVRHGELMVGSARDCQRCHHAGPQREQCASCHRSVAARRGAAPERTFTLAAGGRTVTRRIRFDHQRHFAVSCVHCHSNALTRAPDSADCAGCHAQHHGPTADCTTCHGAANALTTHRRGDHTGCATAQCHGPRAAGLPTPREACLICHAAQTTHMPGRSCDQCHRAAAGGPTTP